MPACPSFPQNENSKQEEEDHLRMSEEVCIHGAGRGEAAKPEQGSEGTAEDANPEEGEELLPWERCEVFRDRDEAEGGEDEEEREELTQKEEGEW